MTDFRYWQNEAGKVGLVMCMTCFESKPREQMFKDENGDVWDECQSCHDEQHVKQEPQGQGTDRSTP